MTLLRWYCRKAFVFVGVRLVRFKGERVFLDELPSDAGNYRQEGDIECGPQCVISQSEETLKEGK